ncbi:MAG: hypothetical protein KJ939_06315 [Nanoarchaeota archaeon]|nr:hypothetical protein [Nanoarchaeota archaeon]MCG2719704.1 hypothetical protein [Nanoarchaeota archaeon]
MKEFVSTKKQLENVKEFKENLHKKGEEKTFDNLMEVMVGHITNLKNIIIAGKKVKDSEIFKTHYAYFKEINKKCIKPINLLKAFDFQDDELEFIENNPSPKGKELEKIQEMFKKRLSLDGPCIPVELLSKLSDKLNEDSNSILVNSFSYSNEEMNKILNGMNDTFKMIIRNETNKDPILKDYILLNLYKDAFELYLKVIKELYGKLKNIKIDKIRNKELYAYFDENYPLIFESTSNILRNDISHLNYDIRQNYSSKQIETERDIILMKFLTAMIVKFEVVLEELLVYSLEKIEKLKKSKFKHKKP